MLSAANLPDVVRGSLTILFIMIVAGAVAYVGDRVGHQVGRRRLTLYGIRPRYTSTIVAVATGMLIALIVTLGAIFASQEVKTAFFKLNRINQEIATLQTRQSALERKVNTGQLVVPTDALMVPVGRIIAQSDSPQRRFEIARAFYSYAVTYVNALYPRLGLRQLKPPGDTDQRIRARLESPAVVAALTQSNLLVTASADRNLFINDTVSFQLNLTPDTQRFLKGQLIAQLSIPGNGGANAGLAFSELRTLVSNAGVDRGLPGAFASNVQIVQSFPASVGEMQTMLGKPGAYVMTAYAFEDIFPHTGGIPIVVVLAPQPK